MRMRTRKLIGTIVLVVFMCVYALLAMALGAVRFAHASDTVQIAYFALAGILWIVPAGLLIRWMQRPDAE